MPCNRARRVSSSNGSGRPPSRPCSSRISRTWRLRSTTQLSGRARRSTGIHFSIVFSKALLALVLVCGTLAEAFDQAIDFFLGETGEQARLACDRDSRVDLDFLVVDPLLDVVNIFDVLAARAEVEQLVDSILEFLRPLEALWVALGQLAHPLR